MDHLKKMRDDVHLDEGLVAEILAHLPAKSVIRFRAVCKEWLHITSCPSFLAEHARRSPMEILLYTPRTVDPQGMDAVVVAADRPAPPRRHLARYPAKPELPRRYVGRQYCSLLASCDGLLLLANVGLADDGRAREQYLVCNPVTRQWTDLPPLGLGRDVQVEQRNSGFYFHEPSVEYRLLCHITFTVGSQAPCYCYCILSTGADRPRQLTVQATPIDHRTASGLLYKNLMTPAVLHGHLHWLKHMEGGAGPADQMVAFDTVAETFRRMPPPPVTCRAHTNLFVADGSLMASELVHRFVDLWVLDGYNAAAAAATGEERWERRHRVEVPCRVEFKWGDDRLLLAEGGDGGDVVLGTNRGVVAYNVRTGTVRQVVAVDASTADTISPSRRVFRASLVRHGFFEARPHPGLPLLRFCS